jgi:hypothetical protein
MKKFFLLILLLALPALLIPLYLFQPKSHRSGNYFKKWGLPKKSLFSKPTPRGRNKTNEAETLDSLLKALLSAVQKNEKTSPSQKSSNKGSNADTPGPATQLKSAFQSLMEQLHTDENGKMFIELFQTSPSAPATKNRSK